MSSLCIKKCTLFTFAYSYKAYIVGYILLLAGITKIIIIIIPVLTFRTNQITMGVQLMHT